MKHREVTGSLIERNGKYTAMLSFHDESGKRRQKSIVLGIPVKGNKRKVLARLEELKREYNNPAIRQEVAQKDSPLFVDFLRDWLKIQKSSPWISYIAFAISANARLDGFSKTASSPAKIPARKLGSSKSS